MELLQDFTLNISGIGVDRRLEIWMTVEGAGGGEERGGDEGGNGLETGELL